MSTILVTHGVPTDGFHPLKAHRLLIPAPATTFTHDELAQAMPEVDAVVACGALDGELIRSAPKLRIIANYGAGYDYVDIAAATQCGIPVTNIPDVTADATAELALGLMLAVSRRIGEMTLRLRNEPSSTLFGMGVHMGQLLRGRTLGIIGVGKIGSRVAQMARMLGMTVIGHNRHGVDATAARAVTMAELLAEADMITLHCPLNDSTRGLIGRDTIGQMKRGAMLINTSRGAVVDSDTLYDAVASGHLAGAGLDVYPDEPSIPAKLLTLPQIVLTPHIGANTAATRFEMAQACSNQILDALAGRTPEHIVNQV